MDKIESFLTNAARGLGELFESTAAAGGAARPAAPADSVDHAAPADGGGGTGVLRDEYQRFDTSGDRRLDDQLLLARTGGPAAARAARAGGQAKMEATGQYGAGDHNCFVLRFDRPVSRAEAEKAIFKEGRTPEALSPPFTGSSRVHDNRVLLGAVSKTEGGKAAEWVLSLPSNPDTANFKSLKSGVEAKLLDAPAAPLPRWIPEGTREVVGTREIPKPGDPRFQEVRTGYPAPHEQVTCWRDGTTTFRYDGRTGRLDGFADRPGAEMGGYNQLRRRHVLEEGMSVDEATAKTSRAYEEHFSDAVLELALGSIG